MIFAAGYTVAKTLADAKDLAQDGVETCALNVSTTKPLEPVGERASNSYLWATLGFREWDYDTP